MKEELISVSIGEIAISKGNSILVCHGLGSCIGVFLYDYLNKTSGAGHVFIPGFYKAGYLQQKELFAEDLTNMLVERMIFCGSNLKNLVAKIAGGSEVFSFNSMNIGLENEISVRKVLKEKNIPVVASNTGGNQSRTAKFFPLKGILEVKSQDGLFLEI